MAATTQGHSFSIDLNVEPGFEQDARWIAVQELATSPLFIRSPRLSQLLLYLAMQTLRHGGAEITEQAIAFAVFSRGEDFHPSSDTIVRSHLLRLRQRLEQHELQMLGKTNRFRISIPRGQYAVIFRERETPKLFLPGRKGESQASASGVEVRTTPPPAAKAKSTQDSAVWLGRYTWIAVMCVCIVLGAGCTLLLRSPRQESALTDPLWLNMFAAGETTNVVAADSSLVILHQYLHHDTSLAEYVSGNYRQSARTELRNNPEILSVGNRRYTSMVDASIVQHAGELANRRHANIELHFAREFTIGDLKRGNAILSGSHGANPWVELFEPQMNFIVTNDYKNGSVYVKNRHPNPGESERYIEGSGEPGKPLYGVLAYLPNLEQPRNVLILEGSSLAATQGIVDLVFNEQSLRPILSKMRRKDGSLAHFEVLVASTVVNGNASKFQTIAYRLVD